MDLLRVQSDIARFDADFVKLLMELTDRLGNAQSVLALLQEEIANPGASQELAQWMAELGIGVDRLTEFLEDNQDEIDWITGSVGDFGSRSLNWPLKATGKKSIELAKGTVAIDGAAGLTATINVDDDGELLDHAIEYDKDSKAYLVLTAEGTLQGSAKLSGQLGAVNAGAAFAAGASITLENLFGHGRQERILEALWRDLNSFRLPGSLAGAPLTIPNHYVHLRGEGNVQLSANVGWAGGFVSAATVTEKGLVIDETVSIEAAVSASLSYSYLLSGYTDILLSRSPEQPADSNDLVRVALAVSKTSDRQVGFKVGAGVGIEGVDRLGKAVLGTFVPKLDELVKLAENKADEYQNLAKLFSTEVGEQLNNLLAKQEVTSEIEAWLRTIGNDTDLTAKLKSLIEEALDEAASPLLDNLQAPTDEAIAVVRRLIGRYQAVLERINDILKKSASLKIGVEYSRKQRRIESEGVWLAFDLDPAKEPELFRSMLFGDFEMALRVQREEPWRIQKAEGLLTESGSLDIESTLSVTALGMGLSARSILHQAWEATLSLNGDIAMAVTGQLKRQYSTWRTHRATTFLAESRVLAHVGDASALVSPQVTATISLELSVDYEKPKIAQIEKLEARLAALAVTSDSPSMVKDLAIEGSKERPFGPGLTCSAMLDLDGAMIESFLQTERALVHRTYATNLLLLYADEDFRIFDSITGAPLILWPAVADVLGSGKVPLVTHNMLFEDSGGKTVIFKKTEINLRMAHLWQMFATFRATLARLDKLHNLSLAGVDRVTAIRRLAAAQKDLLKTAGFLVGKALPIGGARLGDVLFKTFYDVLKPLYEDLDPFAVVKRDADETLFTFD